MRLGIHFFCTLFLVIQVALLPTQAAAEQRTPVVDPFYLKHYKQFKTTHELANSAKNFKSINNNISFLVQKILSFPNQPLPDVRQQKKNLLVFKNEGLVHTLKHLTGAQYLLDGQLLDLSQDLSHNKLFTQIEPHLFIPSAEAVAPLLVLAIAAMLLITGSLVCTNSTLENYFGKQSLKISWRKPPGVFDQYFKDAKVKLKNICPGAANADLPESNYSYKEFFRHYCADIKPGYRQTTQIMAAQGLNETLAQKFYGSADNYDKALIAAAAQDSEFMSLCIESAHSETSSITTDQNQPPAQ